MNEKSSIRKWLYRLFIGLFSIIACFAMIIVLARYDIMSPGMAALLGIVVMTCLFLILRQNEQAHEIRFLKAQSVELGEYENEIHRRIDTLSHQIHANHEQQPPKVPVADAVSVAGLQSRISALENGDTLNRGSDALADDNDVHPIEAEPEIDAPAAPAAKAAKATTAAKKLLNQKAAMDERSLNMHLQPIVGLPSRQPVYFDAFMRLNARDGGFVDQAAFEKMAASGGLMPTIDKKIVFSAVRMVRKLSLLKKQAGIFCPLTPKTLLNLHNFREINKFLNANDGLKDSLVIEISQRDFATLDQTQLERMAELSELGFGLALGDVLDLKLDPAKLAQTGFRYVKVPTAVLLHADIQTGDGALLPASLASLLDAHGMALIATEVERDRDAISLIDIEVKLAQGLLFAPPRPVKAELLQSTDSTQQAPQLETT